MHPHTCNTSAQKKKKSSFLLLKGWLLNTQWHHWPTDRALPGSQSHNNKTPGSVVQDMHNDSTMESFCLLLPLLLALKMHTAHSTPDFSRKCFVLDIDNCFGRRKYKCWLVNSQLWRICKGNVLNISLFCLHILLSKQLVQCMLKDQNQGPELR